MNVFILVLAFLFNGQVYTATFTNGGPSTINFPTKEACEKRKAIDLANMDKMLPDGATFIQLACIERQVGAGSSTRA